MKGSMMAAAAMIVFAGSAPASPVQAEFDAGVLAAVPPTPDADRARALRAQAEGLFSQPKQWRRAVRLLEESAQLREASDPEGYVCLLYAGRIRAALGDMSGARQALEKAAAQALARGSVIEAAHAYIDAAFVAAEERQGSVARDLMERASLLSQSPLLSEEQREGVQSRISP